MFDKIEFIDSMIVQLDKVFDMHGSARALALLDVIQRLNTLKDGLTEEDKKNAEKIETLKRQHKAALQGLAGAGEVIGGQEIRIDADGSVHVVSDNEGGGNGVSTDTQ